LSIFLIFEAFFIFQKSSKIEKPLENKIMKEVSLSSR